MVHVLRNRAFRWCWLGFTVSELGSRVHLLAIPILVYQLTGTALGVGLCYLSIFVSMAVVGPFAGTMVDRLHKRRLLICASLLSAVTTALLPLTRAFLVILVLEFLLNFFLTFYYPVFNTALPDIVRPEELAAANALMAVSARAAQLVGPALGALFIGWFGVSAAFLLDAASFVAVGLLVLKSRAVFASPQGRGKSPADALLHGIRYVFANRPIRAITLAVGLPLGSALGISNALTYVFVKEVLGLGTAGYSLLVTVLAVGLLAGSFASSRLSRHMGHVLTLCVGLSLAALGFLGFAAARGVAPA
ncbi:MAG: MFS transporter, partial [Actinobacteria bacterium]|nr:MFS transporter [Actinomycetota bacterium]